VRSEHITMRLMVDKRLGRQEIGATSMIRRPERTTMK
jgi:hypothetical protein